MKRLIIAVALVLAGAATAALISATGARADQHWTVGQLQDLGYSVGVGPIGAGCSDWQASFGNGPRTDLGSDCDSGFQQRLDDFVNATCPCAQTATTSTDTVDTSTSTTTTTDPTTSTTATTGTTATTVTPTDTSVTPTTPTVSQPATATETTDPTAAALASLADRITALEQQVAKLTTTVDRLAAANDAAWLSYQQAIETGDSPEVAAEIARGTALNVVYGLGDFSYSP